MNPLDSVASRGAAPSRTPTKGHGATTGYCREDFFNHPSNKPVIKTWFNVKLSTKQ